MLRRVEDDFSIMDWIALSVCGSRQQLHGQIHAILMNVTHRDGRKMPSRMLSLCFHSDLVLSCFLYWHYPLFSIFIHTVIKKTEIVIVAYAFCSFVGDELLLPA